MKKMFLAFVLATLTACGGGGGHKSDPPKPPSGGGGTTTSWFFGPIIDGENYTKGMPARPTAAGQGFTFDFKNAPSEVDAVIKKNPPSLVGMKGLKLNYTVTGSGFMAAGETNVPGRVGISLQRKGDNWSGSGQYQQYRLYSQSRPLLVAGSGQVVATTWIDVKGKVVSPAVVSTVVANLDNYSVVFGGSFASHGVYATQPASFTMVNIEVMR